MRSARGVSLLEATLTLSVLSVLTAVMVPSVGDYVSDARRVKAHSDVQVLASGLARFFFTVHTSRGAAGSWTECDLLVGLGDAPEVGAGPDTAAWAAPLGSPRACAMDDHLVTNAAAYASDTRSPSLLRHGWAGPYLGTAVGPDPWGRRYAVNVRQLAGGEGFDTIVISAGPDGIVDTPFAADGVVPGGDDILVVVAANGR